MHLQLKIALDGESAYRGWTGVQHLPSHAAYVPADNTPFIRISQIRSCFKPLIQGPSARQLASSWQMHACIVMVP